MRRMLILLSLLLAIGWADRAKSDTLEVLHTFTIGDGQNPQAGLIMDATGNLYGTTISGGALGFGTVFRLTPNASKTAWTETVLHSFCSERQGVDCLDGENPREAELLMDAAGNLYGTTFSGGRRGGGVVFQLTPNASKTAWAQTVLHSFCANNPPNPAGYQCADGRNPGGRLVMDAAGSLYGTASGGGRGNAGVVFQLTPNASKTAWTGKILHHFCSRQLCRDGSTPEGGLLMDAAGNLYGTTLFGGGRHNVGVVFQLTPNASKTAWTKSILHSFCNDGPGPICEEPLGGQSPRAGLIMDATGNLYGTTISGGINGTGTVFRLAPDQTKTAWTYATLHDFCAPPCSDGQYPLAALTMDAAGNLYGTAQGGTRNDEPWVAQNGHGVVFQLTPDQTKTIWRHSILYSFCSDTSDNRCLDGHLPEASSLIIDEAGNLYGTTQFGGTVDPIPPNQPRGGTVFMLKPN